MKNTSDKTIGIMLMICSSFGLILGFLVIIGIVPKDYVWGGRITENSQLLILESTTFIVNTLILWVIAMRVGFMKQRMKSKNITIILYILMALMALNTVGNIFAQTTFEKLMAIPTLISAIGFYILAHRINPKA